MVNDGAMGGVMPVTVQLRASDRRSNFLNVAALGAVTFVCLSGGGHFDADQNQTANLAI